MVGGNKDYLFILKALEEIPFSVGKTLLTDFLQGNKDNGSVEKNRLHNLENFGSLAYTNEEINELIGGLLTNNLIEISSVNQFWKVLELTEKGRREIKQPNLYKRRLAFNFKTVKTEIRDEDKKLFEAFDFFLKKFNDSQKKAITCKNEKILCIAGAGSGKTTVLTKRIEFLIRYRSMNPKKILAITFTKKARQEMMNRLSKENIKTNVETFNSFCEKILQQHNDLVYDKQVRVISYGEKIRSVSKALESLGKTWDEAIKIYFNNNQMRGKTHEQLVNIFLNDCFFVLDYLKSKNLSIDFSSELKSAELIKCVCKYVDNFMKKEGLRDYNDQLLDTIKLFKKMPDLIPKFNHILIDEYQDVNSSQIEFIDLLNSKNLFCVGDPRQSIFGWRGSDIKYILNFEDKYSESEIITMNQNYRSTKSIVELINMSIQSMKLPDLESTIDDKKDTKLLSFDSEQVEFEFVIQRILATNEIKSEIFILARTNRQLNELAILMKLRGIKHLVRSDEVNKTIVAGKEEVTLATIHSIKGLEANMVFVIGCTNNNFPCKASEHPVIEMIGVEEYDKEEEEKRLFYVAMSRAKKSLYLSHSTKNHTYFINDSMKAFIKGDSTIEKAVDYKVCDSSKKLFNEIKEWRKQKSVEFNVPAFTIFPDKTIFEIIEKKPLSELELEEIHGLGPIKRKKYGPVILKFVNNHC